MHTANRLLPGSTFGPDAVPTANGTEWRTQGRSVHPAAARTLWSDCRDHDTQTVTLSTRRRFVRPTAPERA